MSKHAYLNPAWFEPGGYGNSPFDREMRPEWLARDTPKAISAAFRALLAEDAERMEFAAGDTVRLEDFPTNRYREHVGKHCLFKFHQGQDLAAVVIDGKIWSWELKHLTLVRKAAPVAEVQPEPLVHVDLSSQPDVTRAVQLDEHGNVLQEVTIEQLAQLGIVTKPTPPALQVGDIVRLERYEHGEGVPWINCIDEPYIGKEYAIARFAKSGNLLVGDTVWPASACTLIRRAGEAAPADAKDAKIAELRESLERTKLALNTTREQRDKFWSQRDAARAELARLKNECSDQQSYVLDLESAIARKDTRIKVLEVANDSLTQYSSNLTAERDALQASLRDEQAKRASIEAELAACRESRDALRALIAQDVEVAPEPPAHAVGQQPVHVGVRSGRGKGMSWKETTHNGWIILAPIGRDFNSDKVFIPCKGYRDVPKLYATKGAANKNKQRGEKVVRATITTEWEDVT